MPSSTPELPYNPKIHVFIGFDDRELIEYHVARQSIYSNTKDPNVHVYPIKHRTMRALNLFSRAWFIDPSGQMYDQADGRPCSTQFSFTRFLVPAYAKLMGIDPRDYVIFHDSDFLHIDDITKIKQEVPNLQEKSIWVVKHNYNPTNVLKMDNQIQAQYNRKNWSSFILFNLQALHANAYLVNRQEGRSLHQFLFYKDEEIGELNEGWNFLPDHSEERVKMQDVHCIHYTEATPMMKPECRYAAPFFFEMDKMLDNMKKNPRSFV